MNPISGKMKNVPNHQSDTNCNGKSPLTVDFPWENHQWIDVPLPGLIVEISRSGVAL